jgi:DNA-directed RNA polymerase subunit M/transcription elongation factor TFIIS
LKKDILRAAGHPDILPNETVAKNAAIIEDLLYDRFANYKSNVLKLLKNLKNKHIILGGEYPTFADYLINRQFTKEELKQNIFTLDQTKHQIRMLYRNLFSGYLSDIDNMQEIVNAIEDSCFRYAKSKIDTTIITDDNLWLDTGFYYSYTLVCGQIISFINVNSATCRNYGTNIYRRIKEGRINLKNIAFMTPYELCPESSQKERDSISIRLQQKIELKESSLFECPHCRTRRCSYKEVQKRALDEPASYICTCLNPDCGRQFSGRN